MPWTNTAASPKDCTIHCLSHREICSQLLMSPSRESEHPDLPSWDHGWRKDPRALLKPGLGEVGHPQELHLGLSASFLQGYIDKILAENKGTEIRAQYLSSTLPKSYSKTSCHRMFLTQIWKGAIFSFCFRKQSLMQLLYHSWQLQKQ